MKQALGAVFIAIIILFFASSAQAQSSRLYFAGYFGLSTFTEFELDESSTTTQGDVELKNTFSFAGAMGVRLTPQWRLEAEVSYRGADLDRIDFNAGGTSKIGGEIRSWLYMLNGYYDFDYNWKNFQPFLTAGIGIASHSGDIEDTPIPLPNASDSSFGFAYQAGGGLKYRLEDNLALTTGYRYIATSDLEIDGYDLDYNSHEFRLGVEYDIPVDFWN